MKLSKVFKDGIFSNNPVFIQLIGLCSVLGVSSAVMNSLAMGLALTFVLTGSNIVISLLRSVIPDKICIPCYVVIIATFVTVVDMSIHALSEEIYAQLSIFIGDRLRREHRGEVEQVQRPDAFDLRGELSPGLLREARLPAAHGDLVPNGVNELGWHTDDQHLPDPFGATG